ncbi:MAG: hypothetical protein GEU93_21520 [Propionibacteriales bacterium]|nr:hypothetical protein [Propionibacteriales bacterium]
MPDPAEAAYSRRRTRSGPGRLLVAVYAVFALSATARSTLQIVTRFDEARLAYALSALAAAIYIAATWGLARGSVGSRRVAVIACSVELVGVLAVGTLSLMAPGLFPDATVWSQFGIGYGFVPLVLPVVGLGWLWVSRGRG